MESYFTQRFLAIMMVCAIVPTCYCIMSTMANLDAEYDLIIDNMPISFDDDLILYIDTQTNDRSFFIYNDHLTIRSKYLTFYDLNNSYEHEDVNYVIGSYCYTPPIPAQNATLDSITEINRFEFYSWNGTVSVQCTQYSEARMTLEVNSTDNATLLIRANDVRRNHEYMVYIDGVRAGYVRSNTQQYFDYNYTGPWSNHTLTFAVGAAITEVPAAYLNIIQLFLCLGLFVVVAKQMVLPMRQKQLKSEEVTKTLIKAAIYIVVGIAMITLVFHMFVGV